MSLSINNITNFNGSYSGKTVNINNNTITHWKELKLVFNVFSNGCGQINGIGFSIFNRKKIPFIILGRFDSNLKNIQINKVHMGNGYYNTIIYNISFDLETNKILLNSENAVGEIILNTPFDKFTNMKPYNLRSLNKKNLSCRCI